MKLLLITVTILCIYGAVFFMIYQVVKALLGKPKDKKQQKEDAETHQRIMHNYDPSDKNLFL